MTEEQTRGFTREQVDQLLKPVNENRVIESKGHHHLSQQDVRAHLIRTFGFGNFDIEVKSNYLAFETERTNDKGVLTGKWDVCYNALVRLTIRDKWGQEVAHYEDSAGATAQNQGRGEAHGLAYRSAVSYAIKRCAINLGDQFGLSLYNKGQMTTIVKGTKIFPSGESNPNDVQEGLEQQLSLGLVEDSEVEDEGAVIGEGKERKAKAVGDLDRTPPVPIAYSEETIENAGNAIDMLAGFTTVAEVQTFYNQNPQLHDVPYKKTTFTRETAKRLKDIQHP